MNLAVVIGGADVSKREVPKHIAKDLRPGEVIYWSTAKAYRAKGREGKWVAQVRRRDSNGQLTDQPPVRGFDEVGAAWKYVKSTRGVEVVDKRAKRFGDVYTEWSTIAWKNLADSTKRDRLSRWTRHAKDRWGYHTLDEIEWRQVQAWVTEVEDKKLMGLSTLQELCSEMYGVWKLARKLGYTTRQDNPFTELEKKKILARPKVTIESQHFANICFVLDLLTEPYGNSPEGMVVQWIADAWKLSLLNGWREGEMLAAAWTDIDFTNGAIYVRRAQASPGKDVDDETNQPYGPTKPVALSYPKGGTPENPRMRVIPMSEQAREILLRMKEERDLLPPTAKGKRDYLFPSFTGEMISSDNHERPFKTMRKRLSEVVEGEKHRFGRMNEIIAIVQEKGIELPAYLTRMLWRDTRNSFQSYMTEVRIPDDERRSYMGHGAVDVTGKHYHVVTSRAFQEARRQISGGWEPLEK